MASAKENQIVKIHAKARVGIITVATLGVVGVSALAPAVASATPLRASSGATVTPDILSYYCEDNICIGNGNEGVSDKVDVVAHADEYDFYGHYELQTPSHKTFNTVDTTWRTGTNNNHYFGVQDVAGQYCGTAWEGSNGDYTKIGYICETFPK